MRSAGKFHPPVAPLIDWLKHLPERELSEWELSYHDLSARAFYPRVLIGEYLQSQFDDLCAKARAGGHTITVRTNTAVSDIEPDDAGRAHVQWRHGDAAGTTDCDAVVIASGHAWPKHPQIDGVPLISPWPYTRITQAPGAVGSAFWGHRCRRSTWWSRWAMRAAGSKILRARSPGCPMMGRRTCRSRWCRIWA